MVPAATIATGPPSIAGIIGTYCCRRPYICRNCSPCLARIKAKCQPLIRSAPRDMRQQLQAQQAAMTSAADNCGTLGATTAAAAAALSQLPPGDDSPYSAPMQAADAHFASCLQDPTTWLRYIVQLRPAKGACPSCCPGPGSTTGGQGQQQQEPPTCCVLHSATAGFPAGQPGHHTASTVVDAAVGSYGPLFPTVHLCCWLTDAQLMILVLAPWIGPAALC